MENIVADRSTAAAGTTYSSAAGVYSASAYLAGAQGQFLSSSLSSAISGLSSAAKYSILVGHHPVYSVKGRIDPLYTAVKSAISSLSSTNQPILYLNGHDHIQAAIKPQTADGISTVFVTTGTGGTADVADAAGNTGANGVADLGAQCPCTSQAAITAGTCVPVSPCPTTIASSFNQARERRGWGGVVAA